MRPSQVRPVAGEGGATGWSLAPLAAGICTKNNCMMFWGDSDLTGSPQATMRCLQRVRKRVTVRAQHKNASNASSPSSVVAFLHLAWLTWNVGVLMFRTFSLGYTHIPHTPPSLCFPWCDPWILVLWEHPTVFMVRITCFQMHWMLSTVSDTLRSPHLFTQGNSLCILVRIQCNFTAGFDVTTDQEFCIFTIVS